MKYLIAFSSDGTAPSSGVPTLGQPVSAMMTLLLSAACWRTPIHLLHVQQRVLGRAALPERVAVGQDDVAGGSHRRVVGELEVGIDIADFNVRNRCLHSLDVLDELCLRHITSQQHLVADGDDSGVPCSGGLDAVLDLDLVVLQVAVDPDADHGLESVLLGDPGYVLVSLTRGERPDPSDVGLDDAEPLPNLSLAHLAAGALPFQIRAEADAVDLGLEDLQYELPQFIARKAGDIETGERQPSLVQVRHTGILGWGNC